MSQSPDTLIDAIGTASPTNHAIATTLRALVRSAAPMAEETVKYGGLYYAGARPFCGIFAYAAHVTLEFTRGAELDDPAGLLRGGGQYRRHLRFTSPDQIDAAVVSAYVTQAAALA
ncbi:hypothetical protein VW29_11965 [Devosia limi DSM 17137]|uniref:YdhG-like domain-containing protein n=1 Tax=Devosia limi DSM 17137 TaxID=1121477 RepID=A0A0F5LP15_9HYPH|nr:DUF1801 domain-containing protein [Devosia limi]KKB84091.1 hypothetical protein VW29_11965 [Devosia limi DSM 17137]SHF91105.1 hypothetical protein SAMN02745223_03862 [Devosia limi DSM 17137]